jgi:hypothetical protein
MAYALSVVERAMKVRDVIVLSVAGSVSFPTRACGTPNPGASPSCDVRFRPLLLIAAVFAGLDRHDPPADLLYERAEQAAARGGGSPERSVSPLPAQRDAGSVVAAHAVDSPAGRRG